MLFEATAPYSSRPARGTGNDSDSIYATGGAQSMLVVDKTAGSYQAASIMGVRTF